MKKIFALMVLALSVMGFAQDEEASVTPSDSTEVRQAPGEGKDLPREKRPTYNFTSYGLGVGVWHNWEDSEINPKRDWTQSFVFHHGRIWEMTYNGAITLMDNTEFSWRDHFQLQEVIRIGGRYYFTDEVFSPFVGGGIGLGFQWDGHMKGDDVFAFGFAGGAEAGLTIFKTSKTQLELGCSYDFVTDYIDFGEMFGAFKFYLAVNY